LAPGCRYAASRTERVTENGRSALLFFHSKGGRARRSGDGVAGRRRRHAPVPRRRLFADAVLTDIFALDDVVEDPWGVKRRQPTPALRVSPPTLSVTVVAATRAPRPNSATGAKRSTVAVRAARCDNATATAAAAFLTATGGNRHLAPAAPLSTPTVAPTGAQASHPRPSSGGGGPADLFLVARGSDAGEHVVVVWPVCRLAGDVARTRLHFIYCGTTAAERKNRQ